MYFYKSDVRLTEINSLSKDGRDYTFVTIADKALFQSREFSLGRNTEVKNLKEGEDYDAILKFKDKYVNVDLVPVGSEFVFEGA